AGRIRCRKSPRPPAGSTPSATPKNRINMSPSQNAGMDCPSTANTLAHVSRTLPRRTAEYMPSGTPMRTLMTMATKPSSTVAGKRSQMCSVTGPPCEHGVAEVAEEDVLHVDPVLDRQGLVQ